MEEMFLHFKNEVEQICNDNYILMDLNNLNAMYEYIYYDMYEDDRLEFDDHNNIITYVKILEYLNGEFR